MKICLLLCFCSIMLIVSQASAQKPADQKAAALLLHLNTARQDAAQLNLLDEIVKTYRQDNTEKALQYANNELELAIKLNDADGEVKAYSNIGYCYIRLKDNAKGISAFQKGYEIAMGHKWLARAYDILFKTAVYERLDKNYSSALKNFYLLLNYYKSRNPNDKSHSIYGATSWRAVAWQIAIVYNKQHQDQAALTFLQQILNEYKQQKNNNGMISAEILIADYYADLKRNFSVALPKELLVLKYYKKQDTSAEYADRLQRVGYVYEDLNIYDKAMDYFKASANVQYRDSPKDAQLSLQAFLRDIRTRIHDYQKSLQFDLNEARRDSLSKDLSGLSYVNYDLGTDYSNLGLYQNALYYAQSALALNVSQHGADYLKADILILIANIYYHTHDQNLAYRYVKAALLIAIAGNGQKYRLDLLFAEIIRDSPADLLQKNGISRSNRFAESLRNMQIALKYAQDYQDVELARDCYRELSHTYEMEKNYKLFHDAYLQYIVMRDSVTNQNSQTALNNKLQQVEFSKQADSLKFREQITQTQLKAKQTEVYYFIAGLIALLGMSFFITRNYINQRKSNKVISFEKQRSDDLLLNILPADVAEELKEKGSADARQFEEVTVLFTDFVNFTTLSQSLSAQQLVDELNVCFKEFDAIMTTHNIEKIKTVGDAYLAVAGLPHADANHAANVINAAKDIQLFMLARKLKMGDQTFGIRIGVHSGSVVAGIVGVKKFAYDIWGDTVNTAARMEQNSEPGKINVSEKTYELVKDLFTFTYRGEIAAKNKGMMKMYFAESPGT